jgi:hypothetical protein
VSEIEWAGNVSVIGEKCVRLLRWNFVAASVDDEVGRCEWVVAEGGVVCLSLTACGLIEISSLGLSFLPGPSSLLLPTLLFSPSRAFPLLLVHNGTGVPTLLCVV